MLFHSFLITLLLALSGVANAARRCSVVSASGTGHYGKVPDSSDNGQYGGPSGWAAISGTSQDGGSNKTQPASNASTRCYTSLVSQAPAIQSTGWWPMAAPCTTTTTFDTTITITPATISTTTTTTITTTAIASTSTRLLTSTTTTTTTQVSTRTISSTVSSTTTVILPTTTTTVSTSSGFLPFDATETGGSYAVKRKRSVLNEVIADVDKGKAISPVRRRQTLFDWRHGPSGHGHVRCYDMHCETRTLTSTITSTAAIPLTTITVTSTITANITPYLNTTTTSTVISTVSTTTSTIAITTVSSTTTSYSTTITSYAACATSNIGQYVDGNAITNGNDAGGSQESNPGGVADNSPYDCCVAAIQDPIAGSYRFVLPASSGSCVIVEVAGTNGTCPRGQNTGSGNNVDTTAGASPAFVVGNANCGQFNYLNGALN